MGPNGSMNTRRSPESRNADWPYQRRFTSGLVVVVVGAHQGGLAATGGAGHGRKSFGSFL